MNYLSQHARLVLAILCALLGGGLVVTIATDDGGQVTITVTEKPAVPVAVGVDGPDLDNKPDDVIQLDREAREVAQNATQTPDQFDLAGDLRGADKTPVAVQTGPLATPTWPGCSTRFLPTNWSNRTRSVKAIGLHYTAGGNRAGLSDMNGLTAYASSPAAGVSWHFLIDAEGHCYYSVHVSKKAWTIGNLNSETVNIEVIGRGNEPSYPASAAGAQKLRTVVQRIGKVYGIPMRLGATDGRCNVTRPGIITHWMGGPCSGGHHDIRPYAIDAVVRSIAAAGVKPPSKAARRQCQELNRLRKTGQRGSDRARLLKRNLTRHRYVCAAGKDGKSGYLRRS